MQVRLFFAFLLMARVAAAQTAPTSSPEPSSQTTSGDPAAPTPEAEAAPTPVVDDAPRTSSSAPAELTPAIPGVAAPDAAPKPDDDVALAAVPMMESVTVGASETQTSGSLHTIREEKLQRFEYDDPQYVLQSVPGVYARAEDAVGLRPNIGLRGANSDRSKKVTLMEDGVLFGPAPYSAPAAYYFPLTTRMRSVRILKGPSAILHGPQTVGGSIEYLTREVPADETLGVDVAGGNFGYRKGHGYYGASDGRNGFLIEGVHLGSDGFKELDGGGSTGFTRNEWMLKARRQLDTGNSSRQAIQLKLGYSDESSNETYLGLSEADFLLNPNRRYSASRFDHMGWHRTEMALSHELDVAGLSVVTTAYRNDLDRSWRKVNRFRGASIASVLTPADASQQVISEQYLRILNGQADSASLAEAIMIGPNKRVFVSQGLQSRARAELTTGPLQHNFEFGARYHYDRADRVHTEDGFLMQSGELVPDGGPTETTLNNRASTHAVALHAVDAIAWKRLILTPGVRFEVIRSKSLNRLTSDLSNGSVNALLPGAGLYGALTQELGLFAGAYRGFSPPAAGQADAGPETSWNYEAGTRWVRRQERIEVVGFWNEYSNLTNICSFSNGCVNENIDRQYDAGRARIQGVEAFAEKTWRLGGTLEFPMSVAYTFTRTELLSTFRTADPQLGNVVAGDELPYVPKHQVSASAGVQTSRFGVHGQLNYIGVMREQAGQGVTPDFQLTGALLTVDATVNARVWKDLSVYGNLRNIFDEQVVVSRRPFGARPNAPRAIQVGVKYDY